MSLLERFRSTAQMRTAATTPPTPIGITDPPTVKGFRLATCTTSNANGVPINQVTTAATLSEPEIRRHRSVDRGRRFQSPLGVASSSLSETTTCADTSDRLATRSVTGWRRARCQQATFDDGQLTILAA
jgi:hypothetical protein